MYVTYNGLKIYHINENMIILYNTFSGKVIYHKIILSSLCEVRRRDLV